MRIVALAVFIVAMLLGWVAVAAQKPESVGWITLFNERISEIGNQLMTGRWKMGPLF